MIFSHPKLEVYVQKGAKLEANSTRRCSFEQRNVCI